MMSKSGRWAIPLMVLIACLAGGVWLMVRMLPVTDGATDWFAPLIAGGWMAWTLPTALFFIVIVLLLVGMGVWEYLAPGGNPRVGILHFETTRGDRLFISLLGSAFIHLAWLGLIGANLWWALALSLVYAIGVFRLV
jgi:predicted small integral membrane protein